MMNNKRATSAERRLFFDFDQDLPDSLNQAVVIHHTCTRAFSQGLSPHFQALSDCMATIGASTIAELKATLEKPIPPGQEEIFKNRRRTLDEFFSRQNRAVLLVRLGVLYGMAVADFLRMRLTAPMAYIRLQCESLALMRLMRDNPVIAREWQSILTEKQGGAFFNKYQRQVKSILGSYELAFVYNFASSIALHSRFAGIAFGLRTTTMIEGNRGTQRLETLAQEFDPTDPYPFILMVLNSLWVQERIFSSLPDCAQEISDPLLLETRVPRFRTAVDGLFERFTRQHPELIKRYRQAAESAENIE